ncbi:hypothetical protein KUV46_15615 [Thalassovita mediterranea]|nr:hypothetical protein KUV46_15615 [Thalassovita mediterranea]
MKLPPKAFIGAKLKFARACEHLEALQAGIAEFEASDFYTIKIEHDPATEECSLVYEQTKGIDPIICLALGDAIHNFRSALDYCWMTLVRAHTQNPDAKRSGKNQFPFRETEEELSTIMKSINIKDSFPAIEKIILNDVRPFKRADSLLWGLNKLNNIDKHNLLMPTVSYGVIKELLIVTPSGFTARFGPNARFAGDRLSLMVGPGFKDAEIKRLEQAPAELVFGNTKIFERQPILATMQQIASETRSVILKFEQSFC